MFFSPEQHSWPVLTSVYLPSGEWNNLHTSSFFSISFQQQNKNKHSHCYYQTCLPYLLLLLYVSLCSSVNLLTSWEEDVDVLIIQTEQCTVCSHPMTILLSAGNREGKYPGNKHMVFLHYRISGELIQNSDFTLDTVAKLYKQVKQNVNKCPLSNTETYFYFYEQHMSHKSINTWN